MKQIRFCGAFAMSAMLAFLLMFTGCKKNIAVSGITISSTADTIEVGSTLKLTYTYEPSDATIEGSVWVSSDQAVATVDQSGLVTGVAAGTANIEVTVNGQKTATCAVTVLPKMTGIKLSSNSVTIKVDTIKLLTYTVEPTGAKVYKEEWSSSNDDVVFVDELGYIDAFAEGTALITLKVNDQFTDTCRVTVEKNLPPMTGITISSEAETIDVGSTVQLSYTVEPAEAKVESAVWSSSDTSVATVDQSGLVTAIGVGNATIIITVNGAFVKNCAVRVQKSAFLPGEFSVSATKKVKFTKSNLWWNGSEWHLEENQTDYPTEWSANHVGHFFWTKDAANSYTEYYPNPVESISDKYFADGSDADHMLTVDGQSDLYALSSTEWDYLINSRTSGLYKYGVKVTAGGKEYTNCLIIAPDDYSGTALSLITDWSLSNINNLGLVCLPAGGYRSYFRAVTFNDAGSYGRVWAATPHADNEAVALMMNFDYGGAYAKFSEGRYKGFSIRLVSTVE